MEASQATEVADLMTYAQGNSNTSAEQLAEAYRNCAANANAMGYDIQQTTGLLGIMANQGLKGSKAGTAVSAVFRDMTAKMKDGAIAIGDTNVQVVDTRRELIFHYLSMPVIVTLAAAAVGNLLGYSVFKRVVVSMYYNSYSLPAYETVWNSQAFIKTTLIPVALMFVVNLAVIMKKMRHTPLEFLRHDWKKAKRKKAMRLPKWKFFSRFRLRIIFQNIPNYLILFAGIFFIMVMLAMAVGMPDTLGFYQENAENMMFAKYQYVLKSYEDADGELVSTEHEDAEKFGMYSLRKKSEALEEEISIYGISENSRYVEIPGLEALGEREVL